jgi:3'-phosphoadenosine 5'-phosphosulfate (PAPS) 3'-phosphatase
MNLLELLKDLYWNLLDGTAGFVECQKEWIVTIHLAVALKMRLIEIFA